MKFLVDMPLSPEPAAWLRERGHDALHATDLGLDRAPDTEIMNFAREQGRTIITADLDYPRLLAIAGLESPSVILFRDGSWNDAEVVARMNDVLLGLSEMDIAQSIILVNRDRVRRRRLPIGS
jgi:predicted nuclease of predicted toxin-antitoxin system